MSESCNAPAAELAAFNFDESVVRVVMRDGDPWFVLGDVAKVLGYRDAANASRCLRAQDTHTHSVSTSAGRREAAIVSESGLYRLVMRSRRPDAERFTDWVTDEVLPTIRKTGTYSLAKGAPAPKTYAEALRALADEVEQREAAERKVLALEAPAQAWSALADTSRDYSVADAAKLLARDHGIETGQNRLFKSLVDLGLVYVEKGDRGRNEYKPYQQHVDAGRLVLRVGERWKNPKSGEWEGGGPQLRVTARGLEYLLSRLRPALIQSTSP